MELRFVNREGDSLVFETAEGQRLTVAIDDSIRDAMKKVSPDVSRSVSPREVQTAIRSGETIGELATRLGVPEEVIEPFASPIQDELRFMLQTALSVTLSAGNRMRSFEELVQETYPGSSFAIRKEGDQWVLSSGNSLKWHFDPKQRVIEPVSEAAKDLAKALGSEREVIRQSVRAVHPAAVVEPAIVAEPVTADEEIEKSASVHDLVQELRARRAPEEVKPASAKGRAALPSWDEIVLGTGKLDSDSDQRDS
jgi:hypothetical protein